MDDQYLRSLLVVCMISLVRQTRSLPERASKWLTSLLEQKPARLATVAMANITARFFCGVFTCHQPYKPHTAWGEPKQRVSKTCEMMVYNSATKTNAIRRMSRTQTGRTRDCFWQMHKSDQICLTI